MSRFRDIVGKPVEPGPDGESQPGPEPDLVTVRPVVAAWEAVTDRRSAYLASAIARECEAVRAAPEGRRNTVYNDACHSLGTLAAYLDQGGAELAIKAAARAVGLEEREISATFTSGWTAGSGKPRLLPVDDSPYTTAASPTPPPPVEAEGLEPGVWAEIVRQDRRSKARFWLAERDAREAFDGLDCGTVAEILARPPEPPGRVAGLVNWDANTLLVAQRKTGKTTFALNLASALLLGTAFLGLPTVQLEGDVALLNYEVSPRQIATWAAEIGVPQHRLRVVNVRGRSNPLASEQTAALLAERLAGVELLVVDPFGAAFTGDNENDIGQVRRWLTRVERFTRERLGARDLLLTAHAGHPVPGVPVRVRGASVLADWADQILTLTADEDSGERYLSALGRDVDLDESLLGWHADTRAMTLIGGSRAEHDSKRKVEVERSTVVDLVAAEPGLSASELVDRMRSTGIRGQRDALLKQISAAVAQGLIRIDAGPRGRASHYSNIG